MEKMYKHLFKIVEFSVCRTAVVVEETILVDY